MGDNIIKGLVCSLRLDSAVIKNFKTDYFLLSAPVCKLEEGEEVCYGSADISNGGGHMVVGAVAHPPEDTTDGFFDSTNSNNNNVSNGGCCSSDVPKFELSHMQMAPASNRADCGDPVQVGSMITD